MGMSLYYTARRSRPLSDDESAAISQIETEYNAKSEQFVSNGIGDFWESFSIYDAADPSQPNVIFEGATGIPDSSEEAIWAGLQHWCEAITQIRRKVVGAEWSVHMDDHDITWDDSAQEYDPSQ